MSDETMEPSEEIYFARVVPVVGAGLAGKRVAAVGNLAEVLHLLAANRLADFCAVGGPPIARELRARYGVAAYRCLPPLTAASYARAHRQLTGYRPHLLLGTGDQVTVALLASLSTALTVPLLLVQPGKVRLYLYATEIEAEAERELSAYNPSALDGLDLAYHAAQVARAYLLGERTPMTLHIGGSWPWRVAYAQQPSPAPALPPATSLNCQPVVVLGCGSVGSYAARALVLAGQAVVCLDYEQVEAANPARQFYQRLQIGYGKAGALAANLRRLGGRARGRHLRLRDEPGSLRRFALLIERERPACVLLATGTHADYAAARVLRRLGVPHLIARCYPRALYFEVTVVDGAQGPCFDCVRGHLYTGPTAALTPEQRAAYDRDPSTLQAEPATLLESGRAANVAARLALQLARPATERAAWFQQGQAAAAICYIGGNIAQQTAGGWAYGIARPGQVVRYGVADILGSHGQQAQSCPSCGQQYAIGRFV